MNIAVGIAVGVVGAWLAHWFISTRERGLLAIPIAAVTLVLWTYLAAGYLSARWVDAVRFGMLASILYAFWRYRKVPEK